MGPIGMTELMVIFIILLLFGPQKLPGIARGLGKAMGEVKKARDEFEREITHAVKQAETASISHEPVSQDIAGEPVNPAVDAANEPAIREPAGKETHGG
ncbi:MAG: twin-arginine translocase TatA/TatE family subunit [Verrucomicrobiota bacterium]